MFKEKLELKKLEDIYGRAVVYAVGKSKQTGDTHFIFKKDNKCFGISVKEFDTFEYIEKPSTQRSKD